MVSLTLLSTLLLSTGVFSERPEPHAPPDIPTTETAKTLLDQLVVAPQGPADGFDDDLFPLWDPVVENCNAREEVLRRDGIDVVVNKACAPVSGIWYSPYDGINSTFPLDVEIDEMVPLLNAWRSGASEWTTQEREKLANDLNEPQLWVVTDDIHEEKEDSEEAFWKPPLVSFHCTYAKSWTKVKSAYNLTITDEEKEALASMLDTC
ncbi:uncharacterized protein L3040_004711 [Drepanopeziza brunnea f. sp. 'multigermtubi']|uniref:Secreted protein n=1 Tax=Marssonina brunnea f. sp. multigermtubi (strain MB_m1) TaxID=1072389 RepID=K1XZR4_MARBU|nr:uncharacterized protein MBM_03327 [Drepanopeziza brunnea f. sp. 'multigermtubi' MB_m1]EKD18334.1 secreted protein [Drepanopeziza brunnea f. sp. 'multigermtubi' MB_m1]KAJ5042154.1 hypothetical protein L3040_004711 [Drepanopeziza brunnea f. sp. 'multigermtubi']